MNYWSAPSFILNKSSSIDMEKELIRKVCDIRDVSINDLMSKSRHRNIVESRYIIMYVLNKFANYSLSKTANVFGKDHSTVVHAKKSIEDLMFFDKRIKSQVESLSYLLKFNYKKGNKLTSEYRGVSWHKDKMKWRARIMINGKQKYLGIFNTELEAAMEYEKELLNINN